MHVWQRIAPTSEGMHLKFVHAGRARPTRGLVGGHDHALQAVLLEQRVERHQGDGCRQKEAATTNKPKRTWH